MNLKDGSKTDSKNKNSPKNPYDKANFLSKIYCWYILPFLIRNYRKDFTLEQIDPCPKNEYCDRLASKLRKHWNHELARQKCGQSASLVRALIKCFGLQFLFQNVKNFLMYGVFRMTTPILLGRVIHYSNRYFEEKNEQQTLESIDESDLINQWFDLTNRQNVIFNSCLLCAVILMNFCVSHPYYFCKFRYGMNVRVAVTKLVYEKALKVTNQAVQRITVGKIVNLVSNDANRFDMAYVNISQVYMSLIETVIGMFLLYQYVGRACFGALGIIILFIPFQTVMAHILGEFRSRSIALTDDRLRLMAEILPAMRVIKMYVWEKPFANLVHIARKLEITKIRHSMILRSINLAFYFIVPKVMGFVCIILFLLDGGQLNAENVFVTLALIQNLRDIITYLFPLGVTFLVEIYISVKRIEKFLIEEEISDYQQSLPPASQSTEPHISLDRVTVRSELDGSPILKDVSFQVTPGKLTVIIGPVGSGKSSVLLSILKELPVTGKIEVGGKLAYASQEAWIFNGTVRENILFGKEFDEEKYREVVKMAALIKDFDQFEYGDQTMVDDRGTSLSGGQRARLSLARTLYTSADCYLLDDPLSAVDASVAKHIFEKCINSYLSTKCVILVTHQLQFIKQAAQIVVMKDGTTLAVGSYMELLNRGIDVYKYSVKTEEKPQPQEAPETRLRTESINSDFYPTTSRTNSFIESETDDDQSILDHPAFKSQLSVQNEPEKPQQQNVESSYSQASKNKLKIYWTYISAGASIWFFGMFVFVNIFTQTVFTGSDYWLSAWTDFKEKSLIHEANSNYTFDRNPIIAEEEHVNILIYSGLVLILFIFSIIRTVSYFTICMKSSVNLHNRIFSSLIQAPIVFFDKTPVGIIMNRVSRDLSIIDDLVPPTAFEAIEIIGNCAGVFILCTALNYIVVFPFIGLMIMIYFANKFYVNTARKLKRLEAVARSPLFNLLASTLNGLTTLRSYKVEDMFNARFSETQDLHSATYFTFISASRIYGIFLETVCVVYIFIYILVLNINLDALTGSVIGLTVSQSLQLTNSFNWGIRQYTEVETYMTSVERIAEFGQLDKEELEKAQLNPTEEWPSKGDIEYQGVSLVYNQLPNPDDIDEEPKPVLKDLSFTIYGSEKIGIVGRTGAGKSSLISTLFRLSQPSGVIKIDGIDTADVSLARLRRSLSIIPQEPILFSGNIRRNLDPFNEKSDEELWDAIDKVQLRTKIQSFPAKLDSPVSECGSDFSVGQKQLICLARAILRRNRILILDECTANVDPRTDALIQQTIRTEFVHCTVLTIAHRLNTIIDYDRVMVLDAGMLSQFDSPYQLIKQKSGIFYELYSNLNADTKVELKKLAKNAHYDKQGHAES